MTNQYDRDSAGAAGFKYITGATLEGNFVYLVCDTDATFSAVTVMHDSDDLPSVARSEGMVIAGLFSSVTVTSGSVRAYINGKV